MLYSSPSNASARNWLENPLQNRESQGGCFSPVKAGASLLLISDTRQSRKRFR